MGSTRFREGDVTVTLTGDLETLARRALDAVLPGVTSHVERRVNGVLGSAAEDWPVKTGRSRAGLERATTLSDTAVTVAIRNDVPYAPYVKPRVLHGASTAWQRYVRGPMGALRTELVEELRPEVVTAMREAAVMRAGGARG